MDNLREFLIIYEPNGFVRTAVFDPDDFYIEHCEDQGYAYTVVDGQAPEDIHFGWYFDIEASELKPRPMFNLPERVDLKPGGQRTFSKLPVPCTVKTDDGEAVIDDGKLTIKAAAPETYTLTFSAWPHIDQKVTIHVAEA
jgi:hypothetical protein